MRKAPEGRNRHQGALTLIFVMASSGVVKVILSFYRDDEGSTFERHRGRVPFDIEKQKFNGDSLQTFHRIHGNQTASGKVWTRYSFDLKLFRLEKIDGKAENFAMVTKAQLNMELPFLMGSTTSELNGGYFVSSFCLEFCPHTHAGFQTTLDQSFPRSVSD